MEEVSYLARSADGDRPNDRAAVVLIKADVAITALRLNLAAVRKTAVEVLAPRIDIGPCDPLRNHAVRGTSGESTCIRVPH